MSLKQCLSFPKGQAILPVLSSSIICEPEGDRRVVGGGGVAYVVWESEASTKGLLTTDMPHERQTNLDNLDEQPSGISITAIGPPQFLVQ